MQLSVRAEISSVNSRPEFHGDEKELACDVSLTVKIPIDQLEDLIKGGTANINRWKKSFWSNEEHPMPNSGVEGMAFATKFENHMVNFSLPFLDDGTSDTIFETDSAKLTKFRIKSFISDHVVELSFQAKMDANGQTIGVLSEMLCDGTVHFTCKERQGELELNAEE